MSCYLIAYDLQEGDDYKPLHDAIKAYGTWAHITESCWAVVSDQTAKEIRENLAQYIGSDGRIFVLKSASVAAWKNVMCRDQWLKDNL